MRGHTEFVEVKRLLHGDTMHIVKWIAEKYPNEFEIIVPEKEEKKVEPPKKKDPAKVEGKGKEV